jgi:hypothetical protein
MEHWQMREGRRKRFLGAAIPRELSAQFPTKVGDHAKSTHSLTQAVFQHNAHKQNISLP